MKIRESKEIKTLVYVLGIFILIIGSAYVSKGALNSASNNKNTFSSSTYSGQQSNDQNQTGSQTVTNGSGVASDKRVTNQKTSTKNHFPKSAIIFIDAIMAAGLFTGLSLILRGKVKLLYIVVFILVLLLFIDVALISIYKISLLK